MEAAGVPLLALLLANGSLVLDCVCNHLAFVADNHDLKGLSDGEAVLYQVHCQSLGYHLLKETCETLEMPSIAPAAVARLVSQSFCYGLRPQKMGPNELKVEKIVTISFRTSFPEVTLGLEQKTHVKEYSYQQKPSEEDSGDQLKPSEEDSSYQLKQSEEDTSDLLKPSEEDSSYQLKLPEEDSSYQLKQSEEDSSYQQKPYEEDSSFQQKPSEEDISNQLKPSEEDSSYQQKPSEEDSNYQLKPSEGDSSYQQKPSEEDSSYQQKPSEEDSSFQQKPSEEDISYQLKPSEEDSSYQQKPSEEDSNYQLKPSEGDSSYQQKPSEEDSSYQLKSSEEDSSYQQKPSEEDSSYQLKTSEEDSSYLQKPSEEDSSYQLKTSEEDSSYLQKPSEEDSSYQLKSSEEDSSYQQKPSEEDNIYQLKPSEEDSSYQLKPPEEDSSYQLKPSEEDSSYQQKLSEEDSSYQLKPSEEDSSYQQKPSEEDSSYQQKLSEEDSSYQLKSSEEDSSYQQKPSEEDNIYQLKPSEEDSSYQLKPPEEDSSYQLKPSEEDSSYQQKLSEEDSSYQLKPSEEDSSYKLKPSEEDSSYQQKPSEEHSSYQLKPSEEDSNYQLKSSEEDSSYNLSRFPEIYVWGTDDVDGALFAVSSLTRVEAGQLASMLTCHIAADCIQSCSLHGLNDTVWNATSLGTDVVRRAALSRLLASARRVFKAIVAHRKCAGHQLEAIAQRYRNKTERNVHMLEDLVNYTRDAAQLFSLSVQHVSQLFVPLAFEHMGNQPNAQELGVWINNMERVRDMLHTKLYGWELVMQPFSKRVKKYQVEEDMNGPVKYIIRKPLLSARLLMHQEQFLSFRQDLGALCERHQPNATQVFGLADALYAFYNYNWFIGLPAPNDTLIIDEKWQLEDQSNTTLSVDTDCLQLLVDTVDRPRCPLEELPLEASRRRRQCREQLWDDMVQRRPHIPVTSYLAYTQRANVNLCLLAWMAANSLGICQDVPFSVVHSMHDALCYFNSPEDLSCLKSNAANALCSVSRAILLFKCRDFSFRKPVDLCTVELYTYGSNFKPVNPQWRFDHKGYVNPTVTTLNYKASLTNATLKYRNFKIDSSIGLEYSFIAVNIVFRLLTASVYMCLPHLHNLPGKILLSYHLTGLAQVLCSEVLYRMAGFPDLSTAVLVDSSLTLLGCLWLNTFSFQMYACVRDLRLPNDLTPGETSEIFCRQLLWALIPWTTVSAASIALEKTNKYYLFESRILLLLGIALSVAFNLVCLALVRYLYQCNRIAMRQLKIYSNSKFASKKQLVFMSVKNVILSGIGVMIRIGFHQAQDIAQVVYYAHIASMLQGPVLFVFFVCNGTTLAILKRKVLVWWKPGISSADTELCSMAEINVARRRNEQLLDMETSV